MITNLRELQEAIIRLPPVAEGCVRVFRGQWKNYGSIIPAAFRKDFRRNPIWGFFSNVVASKMAGRNLLGVLDDEKLQALAIWQRAIAQHYGSGSEFLDVTTCIEVAAWFALHKSKSHFERALLGPPGPSSPHDRYAIIRAVDYEVSPHSGYIFAFDVRVWDQISASVPPLTLVDLASAPAPFASPRFRAQRGSLINTKDLPNGDLYPQRIPGTPIEVAGPFADSPIVQRPQDELFPGPSEDLWYREFLLVPMSLGFNSPSDAFGEDRTVPLMRKGEVLLFRKHFVTVYRGVGREYNDEVARCDRYLYPALLHKAIRVVSRGDPESPGDSTVLGAVPIVLEVPLLGAFAPAESDSWNFEVLTKDIPHRIPAYTPSGERSGDVDLRDVLIQFSEFENVHWESSPEVELRRGIWLRRREGDFSATLMVQKLSSTRVTPWGPASIRYNKRTRRFDFKLTDELGWNELDVLPWLGKPFIIALYLLRALNERAIPDPKPSSTLAIERDSKKARFTHIVSVYSGVARLCRVVDPDGGADWFHMRDTEGVPFTEAKQGRVIQLQDRRPFANIPAKTIYASAERLLASKKR